MRRIVLLGNLASTLLNFRYELIQTLITEDVEVFCMVNKCSAAEKAKIEALGAQLIEIPLNSKGINPLSDIHAVWCLQKQLKIINPDVFFAYFVKPVIFGTIAARLARVKRRVGLIEGLGNAFTPSCEGFSFKAKVIQKVQVFLYKLALPLLDTLVVLNSDDKKDLVERYNIAVDTVVLGGIGVDLDKFAYTEFDTTQSISFIFVGRLLREKGIFEFLQAAVQMRKHYPQSRFYVLGGFEDKNPFALQKKELDYYLNSDIVKYPGHISNITEWLAKAAVFVLPSFYREGVPRSTQEAMAIGRPIITTDVPGCRETVEDGVNGFLIPPYDTNALVEAMEKFIKHPELVAKMGEKSREIAEDRYNVYDVNKKIMAILFPE